MFQGYVETDFIKRAQNVSSGDFINLSKQKKGNIKMVKWTGKFSLLLKRLRDAWMEMLPIIAMSQEQRETEHRADVARENIERLRRGEEALGYDDQETRDQRHATQVTNHERLFSFSDNLTTLMFTVASDLSEARRERDAQALFPSRE